MEKNDFTPRWYMVHTYTGYENRVKDEIERVVAKRGLTDMITELQVPTEVKQESRNGITKSVVDKVYPGYVIIKMIVTDDTWYIVRNTRGVTGFVGMGNQPIPLTDEEVVAMGVENIRIEIDVSVGETVCIIKGPFSSFSGKVLKIDKERQKITLEVDFMGSLRPCELDFCDVQRY